jgi:hypothetical protein
LKETKSGKSATGLPILFGRLVESETHNGNIYVKKSNIIPALVHVETSRRGKSVRRSVHSASILKVLPHRSLRAFLLLGLLFDCGNKFFIIEQNGDFAQNLLL